jgi:hypothetical protein
MKQAEQAGDKNDACLAGRIPAGPPVNAGLMLHLAQAL